MHPDPQTQLSFLHAIMSEPGEVAPRLVYADWLEDQGDPLAEVIRLQVETDSPGISHSQRDRLRKQEHELLNGLGFGRAISAGQARDSGHGGLPDGCSYAIVDGVLLLCLTSHTLDLPPREWVERFGWFTVRLGVYDSYESRYEVDEAMLRQLFAWPLMERCIGLDMGEVERFYGDCDRLLREWPGAKLLRLRGLGLSAVTEPGLQGLVDLALDAQLTTDHVATIKALPSLRRLNLSKSRLAPDVFEALARGIPVLRSLALSYNRIGDAAILLARGAWPELVELDLSDNPLPDAGALALIHSPNLPRLRRLKLASTMIGTATVEALCQTERLLHCGELDLIGCPLTDDALIALSRSPHASHLRSLSASSDVVKDETTPILTDVTAHAIANSPHLKELTALFLLHGNIGPEGAEALANRAMPKLEVLELRGNPIGDRGAMALAKFCRDRGDPALHLWRCGVTAEGVASLVASGHLAGLESLWLGDNPVGDAGVAFLAGCPDLAGLRYLWLDEVGMTDTGARALMGSPHLPRGLRVGTFGNDLSDEVTAELRERFRGG